MEQYYVFLKNNRVENIAVFSSQDEELADMVANEQGFDDAIWVGDAIPAMYSTYDGVIFTPPTLDYLYEIGISDENSEMQEERLRKIAENKEQEQLEIDAAKAAVHEKLSELGITPELIEVIKKL